MVELSTRADAGTKARVARHSQSHRERGSHAIAVEDEVMEYGHI